MLFFHFTKWEAEVFWVWLLWVTEWSPGLLVLSSSHWNTLSPNGKGYTGIWTSFQGPCFRPLWVSSSQASGSWQSTGTAADFPPGEAPRSPTLLSVHRTLHADDWLVGETQTGSMAGGLDRPVPCYKEVRFVKQVEPGFNISTCGWVSCSTSLSLSFLKTGEGRWRACGCWRIKNTQREVSALVSGTEQGGIVFFLLFSLSCLFPFLSFIFFFFW